MSRREYPESPLVGVGGVVISGDRVLLARRGAQPLRGEWSIPGGLLETGETLEEGVAREILEETGLQVRVVALVEALERIFYENASDSVPAGIKAPGAKPQYHYVILDYLCEVISGEPRAGGDVTEVAFASETDLAAYHLGPKTLEVIGKALTMARARR